MDIAQVTGIIGAAAALLTSGGALYVSHRSAKATAASNDAVSWEGLTKQLQVERDELRIELHNADDYWRKKIEDLRSDYDVQLKLAQRKIAGLDAQVQDLMKRLYLPPK